LNFIPKIPSSNPNVSSELPIKAFLILLFGTIGFILLIYWILGFVADYTVRNITLETEIKIAGAFSRFNMLGDSSSTQSKYIQELVDSLQSNCTQLDYNLKVRIINNKSPNAIALPGGTIMVFTGLLEQLDSENALAFVLAHEIGHFAKRHHLRSLGRGLVLMAISAIFFSSDNLLNSILEGTLQLNERKYSRKHEIQADKYGLESLNCLYGHVGGATDFFTTLSKLEVKIPLGHYFSTHPETKVRIDIINNELETKGFEVLDSLLQLDF